MNKFGDVIPKGFEERQKELDFGDLKVYLIETLDDLPNHFQLKIPGEAVAKRNDFIRYRLVSPYGKDPLASRLFACIVACCHSRKDSHLTPCNVAVKEFMPWTESGKDYTRAKQAMKSLMAMMVEIETENKYRIEPLVYGGITYNRKTAVITTELNPRLAVFFLQLFEKYTTFGLLEFASLKTFYSQRLFEIACSIAPQKEEIFPLSKLQRMLDITQGTLLRFSNFKQKVLEPTKKEINKYTNVKFDYEPIKEGRAVAYIKIKARRMDRDADILAG